MESFWNKAKTFAEEAANKSQSLTNSTKIADLFAETAKKSKEFALEASKKADEFKTAALKQADQIPIKSITDIIPPQLASSLSSIASSSSGPTASDLELQKFGITDDLRDFVKGLTSSTFQNFPIQDEAEASDVPNTTSNVRKDLTGWQERHATLVLATVKGISKLRYELCPRVMKERKFWKIYFTLVSTHVAPYEKQYMEEIKLKDEKKMTDDTVKPTPIVGETSKSEVTEKNLKSRTSTSSSIEQDLDTFLLGDLEESDGSDGGPGMYFNLLGSMSR
ncbi:BSD domain-containing protein [Citrus sinensis]|uniref:BSD domain-containing protein n=1 Tax=Citrus sinensis TaxID=2711 RepID=A0ACB8LFX4_CITSI|nr:BSD domain-containing protein [Citrus sinensis]